MTHGANEVQPTGEPLPPAENKVLDRVGNVDPEDYSTQGRTVLATRRGYQFVPSNKDLPVITAAGVTMTAEQADEVLAEDYRKVVRRIEPNQEG